MSVALAGLSGCGVTLLREQAAPVPPSAPATAPVAVVATPAEPEPGDHGSQFIGNTIANLRGMDPAFGSRTLTLVEGRRVPSINDMTLPVELNIIPSNLPAAPIAAAQEPPIDHQL